MGLKWGIYMHLHFQLLKNTQLTIYYCERICREKALAAYCIMIQSIQVNSVVTSCAGDLSNNVLSNYMLIDSTLHTKNGQRYMSDATEQLSLTHLLAILPVTIVRGFTTISSHSLWTFARLEYIAASLPSLILLSYSNLANLPI